MIWVENPLFLETSIYSGVKEPQENPVYKANNGPGGTAPPCSGLGV